MWVSVYGATPKVQSTHGERCVSESSVVKALIWDIADTDCGKYKSNFGKKIYTTTAISERFKELSIWQISFLIFHVFMSRYILKYSANVNPK